MGNVMHNKLPLIQYIWDERNKSEELLYTVFL